MTSVALQDLPKGIKANQATFGEVHVPCQDDPRRNRLVSTALVEGRSLLRSEIEQIATSNYRHFIDAAACLTQCRSESSNISSSLDLLQELSKDLTLRIKSYSSEHPDQVSEAAVLATLNECYPLLINILEMPYLMEACIAEKAYDEALDIRDHAQALIRRNPDIKVLSVIGAAIDRNLDLMVQDLSGILEHVLELPTSLQTIGHIRRLGRHSEDEIQMLFLQRREIFLESKLSSESTSDISGLSAATRYLDLIRINLFEIVTQFQAMFTKDSGLLQLWVSHRMESILDMLHTHLTLIKSGSSIATLLEQAMYCGMSLGTIGIDFRAILLPIFHHRIIELFSESMDHSIQLFTTSFYTYSWVVEKDSLSKICILIPDQSPISLPENLFLFPPLAILVNSIFDAFNQIRECATFYVQPELASRLQAMLQKCSSHLSCTTPEAQLSDLCHAFSEIVLPIIEHAGSIIFPMQFVMDKEAILAPLKAARFYSADYADENDHCVESRRLSDPSAV